MTRVPTWTELRLDAIRLSHLQRECYTSVHQLLDHAIPALDRKISLLNGHPATVTNTATEANTQPKVKTIYVRSKAPQAKISHHKPVHAQKKPRRPSLKEKQPTNRPSSNKKSITPKLNSPVRPSLTVDSIDDIEQSLDQLEHLKPPPLPLSEYFRRNRPDLIMRAESRAIYLRKKAERRKYIASTKIINCLEQIRLSSRCSSTYQSLNSKPSKQPTRDNYTLSSQQQARCKLSEHEMKRLTARTYKRLPEVKRKRKEELTTHMKAQNYKNKQEYGRKLLENRRNGIIDYPLKSSYDDRSITSSQSDFSMNGYGRAADVFRSDPYY